MPSSSSSMFAIGNVCPRPRRNLMYVCCNLFPKLSSFLTVFSFWTELALWWTTVQLSCAHFGQQNWQGRCVRRGRDSSIFQFARTNHWKGKAPTCLDTIDDELRCFPPPLGSRGTSWSSWQASGVVHVLCVASSRIWRRLPLASSIHLNTPTPTTPTHARTQWPRRLGGNGRELLNLVCQTTIQRFK